MDVPATDSPGVSQSDAVVGDKRPNENGDEGESVVPPVKKLRFGDEMKRVAEIVLVLSAMGRIRGGKSPTETEMDLMAEARAKLAEMCQELTPKDIVGRDAIGAVIEDLGLNGKLKDQRLGFRAPKLTISEKLSLSKRKMEESKKYSVPSTGYASHLSQPSSAAGAPGIPTLSSATHTVRTLPSDRANHQAVSSGVFPSSSPYVAVAGNVSMAHQWPSNEIKASTASATTVGSHYIRDASGLGQSRMDRPQLRSDVRTSASQGPAISSVNYSFGTASSWSAQPQSNSTADNKVPVQSSVRVSDHSFRPFMSQTTPGTFAGTNQLMHGTGYGQAPPLGNKHAEIAKIVQKFLQPRVHQNATWNPPSREYMNKPITCQSCQSTISDVETVLICDACDKGYHLKCLQANNLKGVPKSEWHCSRCVQLYNGKPFPPKYGRVMRSANTPKVPSNTPGAQKGKIPDVKANQQKTTVPASPALQGSPGFNSERIKPPATVSHSETAGAPTNASLGSQCPRESVVSGSSHQVAISHPETANNAKASATPGATVKNGLGVATMKNGPVSVSEGPVPVGTFEAPLANCVSKSGNSNAISSAAGSSSLEAQGPSVGAGDSNSLAAVTGNETAGTVMDANLSTQDHKVVNTFCCDSQVAVPRSEAANAPEDTTSNAMVNASSATQGPVENGTACGNSSELTSRLETLKADRTLESSQEFGKDVIERTVSVAYQEIPTKSIDKSEKDTKITGELSSIEVPVSQQPDVPSNSVSNSNHLLPENKTSNVQSASQNDAESSQEEKTVGISDARNCECPSVPGQDKPVVMKETTAEGQSIPS